MRNYQAKTVIASKAEVIPCKESLLLRSAEELQQYKESAASRKPTAAGSDMQHAVQPRSKRQRVRSSSAVASPLNKNEVIDQVFSFVGGGDHLYVGGVSRRWRGRYMQYCAKNTSCAYDKKFCTRQRSVLMTARRLLLAISSGLAVADWIFSRWSQAELVCKFSLEPQQVITVLRLHGVPWSTALCDVAAEHNKLSLLQWLHASSCLWADFSLLMRASRGGSVALLKWLLTVTAPWLADYMKCMLERAGWGDHLAAAKWLRTQDVDWPSRFVGVYSYAGSDDLIHQCCSLSTVQWAVASGSGWRDWHCEDHAADNFTDTTAQKNAVDVLQWAHANGCTCTCGHQHQQQQ
jgi:hypothetical protein